ncbi:MAG: hypothetical protein HFF06_04985 [Oscillospiraceae bacterium]|jgi:hypothetical protein|nr:hypothetical protein [Oscillospiraceae bacterium]
MARYQLRYFFDWGLDTCLWAGNDAAREKFGYPVSLGELSLSPALTSELEKLCAEFQTCLNWDDPPAPSPWSDPQKEEFLCRSRSAYEQLLQELGESFEVKNEISLFE